MPNQPALSFLQLLFQSVPGLIEVRPFPPDEAPSRKFRKFAQDVEQALKAVENATAQGGLNIYVGVATRSSEANGTKANVCATKVLWADCDSEDLVEAGLAANTEEAEEIYRERLERFIPGPPSVLVHSGGGLQAYWCLNTPVRFLSPDDSLRIEAIVSGIAQELGSDQVWDASRILRVPGTTNFPTAKKRAKGRQVAPVRLDYLHPDREYTLEAFADLEKQGLERVRAGKRQDYRPEPWDGVPPEKLLHLMSGNERLRARVQDRSKEGLDDCSESGVDYSIAYLLAQEDFQGREIESAIRYSRSLAGLEPKGRAYFASTVGKQLASAQISVEVEEEEHLGPVERILAFCNHRIDNTASFEQLRQHLGVSERTLRRVLEREEKAQNRLRDFKKGRQGYVTPRSGSGLTVVHWNDPVVHQMTEAAHLPDGFRRFIGPEKGLPPNTLLIYEGFGDGFKTSFLLNTALTNAEQGLSVLFISHENNLDTLRQLVARRVLGRRPSDSEEAKAICEQTPWLGNLMPRWADGVVHVNELIEEIRTQDSKPDLVVYDYLNQSLITADRREQQSLLANIVQALGRGLVDEGIPVFTACQLKLEKGMAYTPETWEQRASVVLQATGWEADPEHNTSRVALAIRKNKAGYDLSMTRDLVMVVDRDSHRVLGVQPGLIDSKEPAFEPEIAAPVVGVQVWPTLPETFSLTELRRRIAPYAHRNKDHVEVHQIAELLSNAWISERRLKQNGRGFQKTDPPTGGALSDETDLHSTTTSSPAAPAVKHGEN